MKALKVILSLAVVAACSASTLSSTALAGTRHAVIVHVATYSKASQLPALPSGARRNAEQLQTALVRGGVDPQNITVISSDAMDAQARPTREVILSRLQSVAQRTQSDDSVVVIVIGHGREVGGVSYLCPSDASDEALHRKDVADRELVAIPVVSDLLKQAPAHNKLLIVDACRDTGAPQDSFVRKLEKTPEGVCVMTSCSQRQYSYSSPQLVPGDDRPIFTHFVAEGLAGDADLIGNNDGQVSLFELFSYTYRKTKEAAGDIGESQDPELFTGVSTSFAVSTTGSFAPRMVTTSDAGLEHRQTALLMADSSLRLIREGEQRFKTDYDEFAKAPVDHYGRQRDDAAIYRDHHNRVCLALGTYITPALELDRDCRVAHLARGFSYRSCGAYREALADYEQAHEHFELFVKGDSAGMEQFLEVDEYRRPKTNEKGQPVLKLREKKSSIRVDEVALRSEPSADGSVVRKIGRQSKVRVEKITNRAGSEWLLVTAVNDQVLPQAGWLPRQQTHWFAEAADLYIPASPLGVSNGLQGNGLAKLDQAAAEMHAVAYKIDQPTRDIQQVKNQINSRLGPLTGIPFGGGYIAMAQSYATQPLSIAQSYTSIPSNYVRMAAGYVQMPANYARAAQGWAGTTQNYYAAMDRTEKAEQRRAVLVTAKFLKPITEQRVQVEPFFLQGAHTVAAK